MARPFSLFKFLCRLWFQASGWKLVTPLPDYSPTHGEQRYVVIGAPHTSNWDFIIGMGAAGILQYPFRFTIKKEWLVFPFKGFMLSLGAIPIDRNRGASSKKTGMTGAMIELLQNTEEDLFLVVTPEATRSRREKWKTGFYHIALEADVPILLGFLDYQKKEGGIAEVFHPTGDKVADMRHVMDFYQSVTPKYPELFSVDKEYSDND